MHQRNLQNVTVNQLRTDDSRLDVIMEESPEKGRPGNDALSSKVHVLRRIYHDPAPGCVGEGEENEPASGSFSHSREESAPASHPLHSLFDAPRGKEVRDSGASILANEEAVREEELSAESGESNSPTREGTRNIGRNCLLVNQKKPSAERLQESLISLRNLPIMSHSSSAISSSPPKKEFAQDCLRASSDSAYLFPQTSQQVEHDEKRPGQIVRMKEAVLSEIERLKQLYSSLENVEGGTSALRTSFGSRDSAFGLASSVSGSFSGVPGSRLGGRSVAFEEPYVQPSTRLSSQPTALTSSRE